MSNKVAYLYKVPLLLSLTLGIVLTALRVERGAFNIFLLFLGSFVGTFVLDLDYIIHAYFVEPASEFSKMVTAYVKDRDIRGVLSYIYFHKDEVQDKTLNSGLFQIVLAGATFFVLSSHINVGIKALVVSAFLNSIYRFLEAYMHGKADQWFWDLKVGTGKTSMYIYTFLVVVALLYALFLF